MDVSFPLSRRQSRGLGLMMLIIFFLCLSLGLCKELSPPPPETLPFSAFPVFPPVYRPPCLDINLANQTQWDSLPGIGPTLSRRIVRFRQKKGGFRSEKDLQKVYGLSDTALARIQPYLRLEKLPPAQNAGKPGPPLPPRRFSRRRKKPASRQDYPLTELNTADSMQLEALPGIGEKLAVRILKYREILGFYYSPDQLRAVYGLSEENYQRMRPYLLASLPPSPARRSLNTSSRWHIQKLAFWNQALADSLLQSRRAAGRFDSWDEVKALPYLPPRGLEELQVYFVLGKPVD